MGYFVIVLICAAISFIFIWIEEEDFTIAFLSSLIGATLGILLSVVVLGGLIHSIFDTEEYVEKTTHISALSDNLAHSGEFFLGSGSVEGEMKYFYLSDTKDGKTIKSSSASESYLKDARGNPRIEKVSNRFKNKFIQYWFPYLGNGMNVIYVPENSIKYDFKIDLK